MSAAQRHAASFVRAEEGTIAIIFALMAVVIVMFVGCAIDFGRIVHAEARISSSIDAAALAAAKGLRQGDLSDAEVAALAQRYFDTNLGNGGVDRARVGTLTVGVDRERNAVSLTVNTEVPTLFMQIAGVDRISFPRSSVAVYDSKNVELSVQLDVTGSMRGRKLSDLKNAFGSMLDIMLPDGGTPNKVRISLAPFAGGINAGDYAAAVSDGRSRDGCVYERSNAGDQASEAPAIGTMSFKVAADLRRPQACPSTAPIQPLTDDKDLLRRTVDDYRDSTSTAGHLGSAWAWYLLSPRWSAIWPTSAQPAEYDDARTAKYVVLMTDGIYNTVGGASDGDHGTSARQSTQFALDTCAAMRDKGITVYTIGFEAPEDAKSLLRDCASSPSKFFDATDGTLLASAFGAIASEINNLRLSR